MSSKASVQKHQGLGSELPKLTVSASSKRSRSNIQVQVRIMSLCFSARPAICKNVYKRRAERRLYAVAISRSQNSTAGSSRRRRKRKLSGLTCDENLNLSRGRTSLSCIAALRSLFSTADRGPEFTILGAMSLWRVSAAVR